MPISVNAFGAQRFLLVGGSYIDTVYDAGGNTYLYFKFYSFFTGTLLNWYEQ